MKKVSQSASILLGSLIAANALAGGTSAPVYVGGSYGVSYYDNSAEQMDNLDICKSAAAHNQTCSSEEGDQVGHLYGGLQISEGLGVELGYVNMGDTANYHYSDPIKIQQQTTAVTLSGVAKQRLSKSSPVSAYGKAGVVRWSTETRVASDNPAIHGLAITEEGYSPMLGAGLQYDMNNNVSLRAGWERYYDVGEKNEILEYDADGSAAKINTLETDVDVISAGVNFSFL
ncbi:outer membrane beta-barrel protein [Thiothrix eikelboomii]|uniref:OmpA-like transmembrane domain-containing protein n=1 Tax=Thiothrix eikelboomii TaxID=92487 RepID=A0A1T4WFB3_9GAMM|nr:outer membrane beta-barrel protein [Thiothrix eikelboomii]SKA76012.1 OmpA-like transmembrane domain-containing protein [Thiothrix eikelboomii]